MLSVVPPPTTHVSGRPKCAAAWGDTREDGEPGAMTRGGNKVANAWDASQSGYSSHPGSKPSLSALFQSVTNLSACSKEASQSAWCKSPGCLPACCAACHTPSKCQWMTLHRVEVEAVAVWEAGAISFAIATAFSPMAALYSKGAASCAPVLLSTSIAVAEVPSRAMPWHLLRRAEGTCRIKSFKALSQAAAQSSSALAP
mmetsp:Transcript_18482/g.51866  ORF Transcript_18482/g.51866 Transcript_18482/m.51866 type:complete len:200 (-) Transcript_18482:321-920(-)